MQDSIVVTKLNIPPPRAQLVLKPGLIEQLNAGIDRKLTLVSAPAGFGKTTLISKWVEGLQETAAIDSSVSKISDREWSLIRARRRWIPFAVSAAASAWLVLAWA